MRAPSSSAGARNTLRVDDLKRILSGGGLTAGIVGRLPFGRDGEDTASDSMVEVEGEELGSESGGFATGTRESPKSNTFKARTLTLPHVAEEHSSE